MLEIHVCDRRGTLLRSFALGDNPEVLVGRDEGCDVRIAAPSVSREHCTIEQEGGDIFVRDLNSAGGTYVDGNRVSRVRVTEGMQVTIGPALLRFVDVAN
jgi:pSer/pThr/pTyr-binding forkhead associated (FHA) protein